MFSPFSEHKEIYCEQKQRLLKLANPERICSQEPCLDADTIEAKEAKAGELVEVDSPHHLLTQESIESLDLGVV